MFKFSSEREANVKCDPLQRPPKNRSLPSTFLIADMPARCYLPITLSPSVARPHHAPWPALVASQPLHTLVRMQF